MNLNEKLREATEMQKALLAEEVEVLPPEEEKPTTAPQALVKVKGRKRKQENRKAKDRLPKIETDEHRRMRSAYLAMGRNRSYRAVAKQFGMGENWVSLVARAFNWTEDAQQRDQAIINTFAEEHRKEVNEAQRLVFYCILDDIRKEALKRGLKMGGNGSLEPVGMQDIAEAYKKVKDEVTKEISIRNYKEMNELLVALKRVVYDFHGEIQDTSPAQGRAGGGVKVDNMQVALIIEK